MRRHKYSGEMRKWRRAFTLQRRQAAERGILFELTWEEWLLIWQTSGKLSQRGKRSGQYCMARYGDTGPYAVWNVRIITVNQNNSEQAPAMLGRPVSAETRRRQSEARKGKPTRLGAILSDETKRKI